MLAISTHKYKNSAMENKEDLSTGIHAESLNDLVALAGKETIEFADGQYLTQRMLAYRLDISDDEVRAIVDTLGLVPMMIGTGLQKREAYSAYDLERINFEIVYQNLPDYVGITQIANSIDRHFSTTKRFIEELGLQPAMFEPAFGRQDARYGKGVVRILKEFDDTRHPKANGWTNVGQLAELFDEDPDWIKGRLTDYGLESETRRNPKTGRLHASYDRSEAIFAISKARGERPSQSDSWATVESISKSIGRSESWVRRRLDGHQFEVLLDANRVPRNHYSPESVQELINESETLKSLPEAKGYLSVKEMAKRLGKFTIWVEQRVEKFEQEAEVRTDKLGRANLRYPPHVFEMLEQALEEWESIPEAEEGLFTLTGLAEQVGHTTYWVKRRLEKLDVEVFIRKDSSGHPRQHYLEPVVELLLSLG